LSIVIVWFALFLSLLSFFLLALSFFCITVNGFGYAVVVAFNLLTYPSCIKGNNLYENVRIPLTRHSDLCAVGSSFLLFVRFVNITEDPPFITIIFPN
jgi:hypothetical protein